MVVPIIGNGKDHDSFRKDGLLPTGLKILTEGKGKPECSEVGPRSRPFEKVPNPTISVGHAFAHTLPPTLRCLLLQGYFHPRPRLPDGGVEDVRAQLKLSRTKPGRSEEKEGEQDGFHGW